MNEMDRFTEMKGYYIVMDNAPIHTSQEISAMVADRGYRSVYLPPYSPELNPIEKFWTIVKNKVKRSQFNDTEDLITRISEACNSVPPKHLRAFVQHSVNVFEKCLNGEAI
jgi:transposase